MHLRLSIVFEKFLKEKNKSEKGNSFAPPAFRLSAAAPPFFQALEGERPSRRRKPRPSRKRRGSRPAPPGEFFPRSALLPRAPLPNGGPGNRKKRAAALSRPPFVPPLLWERFFSPSRGNRQKGPRFTPFVENFSCVSNRGCPDLPLKSCMRGVPAAHEIFIGSLRF